MQRGRRHGRENVFPANRECRGIDIRMRSGQGIPRIGERLEATDICFVIRRVLCVTCALCDGEFLKGEVKMGCAVFVDLS